MRKLFKFFVPYYIQEVIKIKKIKNLVNVSKTIQLDGSVSIRNKEIYIGKYTYIGKNVSLENVKSIGAYCSISNGVRIGLAQHPIDWLSTSAVFCNPSRGFVSDVRFREKTSSYCKIGNDVWIGTNALIMSNVNIGNGAIVGAGSIVTKDVPDYAIVVGNPAKIIRYRFNEEDISDLQKSLWWNKEPNEILESCDNIKDVRKFLSITSRSKYDKEFN